MGLEGGTAADRGHCVFVFAFVLILSSVFVFVYVFVLKALDTGEPEVG